MSDKLKKLASGLIAIPGIGGGAYASAPAETDIAYRYTNYSEDDSPAARDDSGAAQERYNVQVHQFYVLTPYREDMSVSVDASWETMSGASPAYSYVPEDSDEVVTNFTGASREARADATVNVRRYGATWDVGSTVYGSIERDYLAVNGGVDGSLQINDQMTTLSAGISAGYDLLSPTIVGSEAVETGRYAADGESKWQFSIFEGVGQIIDMNTVVQGSVSFTYRSGYLSDPYRDCPYAEDVPCDIRPSTRAMGVLSLGGRRYLPELDAAVHADYRLYADTWNILSNTLDVDYFHNWAPSWPIISSNDISFQFGPGLRYYMQTAAYFYDIPDLGVDPTPYDVNTTEYYSSDPRLSRYGAISGKFRLTVNWREYQWVSALERYASNPAYGFNFDEDVPGLVAYWRLTTGLNAKF